MPERLLLMCKNEEFSVMGLVINRNSGLKFSVFDRFDEYVVSNYCWR